MPGPTVVPGPSVEERLRQAREVLARATRQPSSGDLSRTHSARRVAPTREPARGEGSSESERSSPPGELPPPEERAAEADPYAVARAIVLRQLAIAPRSRVQLERKLAQRGCDPAVAAAVLDRLTEVGLVDDVAFATILVQSRQRTKGMSGVALRAELREKGIDGEIAEAAVGGLDPQTERARAEDLVARRLATMGGLEPQVQARRLAAMLARKGYSSAVVYAVVRDAIAAAPEHQRD